MMVGGSDGASPWRMRKKLALGAIGEPMWLSLVTALATTPSDLSLSIM
jgi:hypothetical protein